MDSVLADLSGQVKAAREARQPLFIRGGGTKRFYGLSDGADTDANARVLDLSAYTGVVGYQPSELVITVRAGTLLSEVEHVLDEHGQMLAFEPPRFGPASTIGGCIAAGLAGPRRMAAGGVRDFVLGAQLLNSSGAVLDFGGEVMKNVAGYDVSRLLAGSMGIFGALTRVSIKVAPKPFAEATHVLNVDEAGALALFDQWRGRPVAISASAWVAGPDGADGRLHVRLSGSDTAVGAGTAVVGGDEMGHDDATLFWNSLRDQTHSFFQERPLWRLALPPHAGRAGLGPTLIEWNGGQRWLSGHVDADAIRQRASSLGGHATLFRRGNGMADEPVFQQAFQPLNAGLMGISRRLKQALDPAGLFNPKRLFSEF
jgi:glycolate oxidase FAD binding subunit